MSNYTKELKQGFFKIKILPLIQKLEVELDSCPKI